MEEISDFIKIYNDRLNELPNTVRVDHGFYNLSPPVDGYDYLWANHRMLLNDFYRQYHKFPALGYASKYAGITVKLARQIQSGIVMVDVGRLTELQKLIAEDLKNLPVQIPEDAIKFVENGTNSREYLQNLSVSGDAAELRDIAIEMLDQ